MSDREIYGVKAGEAYTTLYNLSKARTRHQLVGKFYLVGLTGCTVLLHTADTADVSETPKLSPHPLSLELRPDGTWSANYDANKAKDLAKGQT